MPFIAAAFVLGGGTFLALKYSSWLSNAAKTALNTTSGNQEVLLVFGWLAVGIGVTLFLVAYANLRLVRSDLLDLKELYRREGVATVQAMERVGSVIKRR